MLKKLLLIIIGIFLSLVILECGLRLAGWTISSYQQYKNNKALRNKSQYTIMCLGESTTQRQYPVQLQEILNEKYPNKFSVIDCGVGGINLENILNLLDGNIIKYKPDITVCMMGINNKLVNLVEHTNDYNIEFIKKSKNINLKIYQLFVLLFEHIKELLSNKTQITTNDGNSLIETPKFLNTEEEELMFKQMLSENPKNEEAFVELLFLERYLLNYPIDYCYNKAIYAIDNNFKYSIAECYKIIIDFCLEKNDKQQLKKYIKKALNDPYLDFKQAIGCFYRKIKPYCDENDLLIINKNIKSDLYYGFNYVRYLEQKDYKKAQKYFDNTEEIRLNFPNEETYNLYKLIVKKLIDNNIKVICMQYPVRSILPLQEQLKNESYYDKLTFISNEKLFKDALMNKIYDDLFVDQFAGDFGHCTDLGNTLIAKNVVNTLEKILNLKEQN